MVTYTNKVTTSDESIKPLSTSDNSLYPGLNYINNAKILVKFDTSCLKQQKSLFTDEKVMNIYIVYEIN